MLNDQFSMFIKAGEGTASNTNEHSWFQKKS